MKTSVSRAYHRVRHWPRWILGSIAVIAVLLIALRLALPWIVLHQINKRLAAIPGYYGHVNAVGIHIWRGAYSLHGIDIKKQNGKVREPVFSGKLIDFSIAWRDLIHKQLVSDIVLEQPQIT